MLIALDYDGTVSTDPVKWLFIARILHRAGDKVICICSRRGNLENQRLLHSVLPKWVDILFTNHNPKKEFAAKRGIHPDIWIDNDPLSLFQSDNPDKQIPDKE